MAANAVTQGESASSRRSTVVLLFTVLQHPPDLTSGAAASFASSSIKLQHGFVVTCVPSKSSSYLKNTAYPVARPVTVMISNSAEYVIVASMRTYPNSAWKPCRNVTVERTVRMLKDLPGALRTNSCRNLDTPSTAIPNMNTAIMAPTNFPAEFRVHPTK